MTKYHSPCPVKTTLNLIGNKWKFLIIRDLLSGTKRFGELKKSISATKNQTISQAVLTMPAASRRSYRGMDFPYTIVRDTKTLCEGIRVPE